MSAINEIEDEEKDKNNPFVENNEQTEDNSPKKIKLLYGATIIGVLVIIVLVSLIVIFLGGNKDKIEEKTKNDENGEEEEVEKDDNYIYMNITHYISWKYEVKPAENEWEGGGNGNIKLFNKKYLDSISSILINDEKANHTNMPFLKVGEYDITIKFNRTLKSTDEMLKDCLDLKELDFPLFKTDNLTNILGIFSGCTYLVSLNLTNFDTSNVKK